MFKPTEKEVEEVLKLQPFERYKYFVKKVVDFEEVWLLMDEAGTSYDVSQVEDFELVSVFPSEIYAQSVCNGFWEASSPKAFSLETFLSSLLVEGQSLLNVFPPKSGETGFVVSRDELYRDIQEEFEWYD